MVYFKSLGLILGFCALVALVAGCKEDVFEHDPSAPMTIESFLPAQGGGGTEILINGSNFSVDTSKISVTINDVPLKVIGANGNQMMVIVPKSIGSGRIVVSIGDKKVESSSPFTYNYTRTVSTLAGSGQAGFANGKGEDAMFNFSGEVWYRSSGITVDDNLNVYVADPGNHCIRKIDPEGNVTTLAGDPNTSGHADGKGSAAKFSLPYSVAVDAAGNVYSADPGNWDIRKITPDGVATTWAWAAHEPWAVAVDRTSGIVYYTSCTSPGGVYPITGQFEVGAPVVRDLLYPLGMGFDPAGNLYVCVHGENTVRRFSAGTWENQLIAGQPGVAGYENGIGTAAKFSLPWGLAVDAKSNVYVAGNGTWDGGAYHVDQSIRIIEPTDWLVSTFAGSGSAGYVNAVGQAAAFSAPTGVAVDKNGTVYVMDKINNRVRKIVSE
jgi:sugar lactone lactonase YvrE